MRPDDRKYLKSHEWCKIDGDIATVGYTLKGLTVTPFDG